MNDRHLYRRELFEALILVRKLKMRRLANEREIIALQDQLKDRTAQLRDSHSELAATNSELLQLTLDLDDRVAQRTNELSEANKALRLEIVRYREAQEALRRSKEVAEQANRAKDQFIAVISHELRTPLTSVMAVLTDPYWQRASVSIRDRVEIMRRNVDLESRLIDDLLNFTRFRQGKITLEQEVIDLHQSVRRALDVCKIEADITVLKIEEDWQAENHCVFGDGARLQQVFWNLIKNAIKFTPPPGRINLSSRNNEDQIIVEIADTGIGIEPDILSKIFDPFEQAEKTKIRQFGGMGLGLTIAKNIIDLHGGRILVCSDGKGHGTTFSVELPAISCALAREKKASAQLPVPGRGEIFGRILLVEDHPDTLRILAKMLQRWGFSVKTANSFQGALKAAERDHFDLLVSDLALPDGSGWDIMRTIRERYPIRGIAMSGFGSDADLHQSRNVGFAEHLTKPIKFEALQAAIQRVLASPA